MQITERDHEPWHLPHMAAHLDQCNADACSQGRTACPTPQACVVADNEICSSTDVIWFWCTYAVLLAVTIIGLVAALA